MPSVKRLLAPLGVLCALCVFHYSARDAAAECPCGSHCAGTACDCGCSEVIDTQCVNCPGGQCPLPGRAPYGSYAPPSVSPADEDPLTAAGLGEAGPRDGLWQWTADADYHAAAVIVRCPGEKPGQMQQMSGGYVKFGEISGVITAKHGIAGSSAEVTFSDGTKQTGQTFTDAAGNDVAFVAVTNDAIEPLAVADQLCNGETVEYVTLGGPESRLRHFSGRVIGQKADQTAIDAHVISGDSGGVILDAEHRVVTVQSCGVGHAVAFDPTHNRLYRPPAKKEDWTVYGTSTAATNASVVAFLGRVHQKLHPTGNVGIAIGRGACLGGNCPRQPLPASPLYPPAAVPVRPAPAPPSADLDAKLNALKTELKSDLQNQLGGVKADLAAKLDKLPIPLGSQLNDVQQKLDANLAGLKPLSSGLTSAHEKIDALLTNGGALNSGLTGAGEKLGALKQKLDALAASDVGQAVKPIVDQAIAPLANKLAAPIAAELGMPTLIGLGAAGGVPGLAAAIGLFMLRSALKKKSDGMSDGGTPPSSAAPAQAAGTGGQSAAPIIVETQSPPPPQRVQRETSYVQIPVDSPELEGLRLGMDEIVRRNPGAQSFVETLKSYARQFTSGLGAAKA